MAQRPRPTLRPTVLAAIAVGGLAGGLVREAVTSAWPAGSGFPWAIFGVNTAGGLILGFLLVGVQELLPPTTYLRPLLGTGFCGALTTFSSVTVAVDRFGAEARPGLAVGYSLGSLAAGLAAAILGIALARALAGRRPGSFGRGKD